MKIIEPSVELIDDINTADIYAKIERCGRVSRQSAPKGNPEQFIRSLIKRGHESVLEHVSFTFHIICDRAIMAELTRHRLASFTVESTRYVKYDELTVVKPTLNPTDAINHAFLDSYLKHCEKYYRDFSHAPEGYPPEIARAVLPLCLKSELYMTANIRQWRHILKLRTANDAHPQMQHVARLILNIFREKFPVFVEDIQP